eukprot:35892-Eustigmatos_ZCMA.PRE.1
MTRTKSRNSGHDQAVLPSFRASSTVTRTSAQHGEHTRATCDWTLVNILCWRQHAVQSTITACTCMSRYPLPKSSTMLTATNP